MINVPSSALKYEPIAVSDESTVVSAYRPDTGGMHGYQSEAQLEVDLIARLQMQAYEYLPITTAADLEANVRYQLELLNDVTFTDSEWKRFFTTTVAAKNEGIVEKTARIQEDPIQPLTRDDGTTKNIRLIDKTNIHNNRLQVINQYEVTGQAAGVARQNRYDVTILVNGLPLIHVELKRRGVALKEAFNQINRYARESFWVDSGLFEYVQLFVISNGTQTKYYSNTTRDRRVTESAGGKRNKKQSSNSFEFTSWWTDANNKRIGDLTAFTKTFFAKHTLLNILTKYCVFDVSRTLLVMRPYQIVAAERILQRINTSTNAKQLGKIEAGGYIWHTTGSGKTLTSFKTAQLASRMEGIDKVVFVVDRKDLDYQTMLEYNRFEKDSVNGSKSTAELKRQLQKTDSRITVTTIQKLSRFIEQNKGHEVTSGHVVLIFDECHRSQFGKMGAEIRKAFKRNHLFGFTGTPIFPENVGTAKIATKHGAALATTAAVFGDQLHTYTIVDAINDGNVLPFRVAYHNTVRAAEDLDDDQVEQINTEEVMMAPERISQVVTYMLDHFDAKTMRAQSYKRGDQTVNGFNAMFATASIPALRAYYVEFARQQAERTATGPSYVPLKIATIFSYAANEDVDESGIFFDEEALDTDALDGSSRDFLERAIADYNEQFGMSFDTSSSQFEGYYKDLTRRVKDREIDLVIVVNMFLTGFDAPTLNTLWVDKKLKSHGLIQAFSRTNRILNSVKAYGNIVCFRNLEKQVDEALALFGNKEARQVVLLKPYADYHDAYTRAVADLRVGVSPGDDPYGEAAEKSFIELFGQILKLRNVLTSFDEFRSDQTLSPRELQDYTSTYNGLWETRRKTQETEKASILDDVVFEIELVKQIEVGIDYVLLMVEKWRRSHPGPQSAFEDRDSDFTDIEKAIDASPSLRNKRDLIIDFVHSQSVAIEIDYDWQQYISERREAELEALIAEENLNPAQTRELIADAFRDGGVQQTGTAITRVLPPTSRFVKGNDHGTKKLRVLSKLSGYVERFFGLGTAI